MKVEQEQKCRCGVAKNEVEKEKEDTSLKNNEQAGGWGCVIITID
jgi:hypothetical protein